MTKLLPLFYLPPVSWCSVFFNPENEILLEQYEHFPKQTYRNRANIYGANGQLSLIIPIRHDGRKPIKQVEVSMRENWKIQHWKSVKTAYQTSPYFEFYQDKLEQIFLAETHKLMEFNLNALNMIQSILKTDKKFNLTEEYSNAPNVADFRAEFSPKRTSPNVFEPYFQSFSDKHGFLPDLSVLDLICNKGPEATTYIKNIKSYSI